MPRFWICNALEIRFPVVEAIMALELSGRPTGELACILAEKRALSLNDVPALLLRRYHIHNPLAHVINSEFRG